MASPELIAAVKARVAAALPDWRVVDLADYTEAPKAPSDEDEFLCIRFIGTNRVRGEVGGSGDDEEDEAVHRNIYYEDGSFRIDVYVRIKPLSNSGHTLQDRQQAASEEVIQAFLGHTFDDVEVFNTANGLDLPAGAPAGWWGDSIACGFHFEHFGP